MKMMSRSVLHALGSFCGGLFFSSAVNAQQPARPTLDGNLTDFRAIPGQVQTMRLRACALSQLDNLPDGADMGADGFQDQPLAEADTPQRRFMRSPINLGDIVFVYVPDSDGDIDPPSDDNSWLGVALNIANGDGDVTAGLLLPPDLPANIMVPFDNDGNGDPCVLGLGAMSRFAPSNPIIGFSEAEESVLLQLFLCADEEDDLVGAGNLQLIYRQTVTSNTLIPPKGLIGISAANIEVFPPVNSTCASIATRGLDGVRNDDFEFIVNRIDSQAHALQIPGTDFLRFTRFQLARLGFVVRSGSTGDVSGEDRIFTLCPLAFPELALTKEVKCDGEPDSAFSQTSEAVFPGDSVEFRITLENRGNTPLEVELKDVLRDLAPAPGVTLTVDVNSLTAQYVTAYNPAPNGDTCGTVLRTIDICVPGRTPYCNAGAALAEGLCQEFFSDLAPGFFLNEVRDCSVAANETSCASHYLGTLRRIDVCTQCNVGDRLVLRFKARVDSTDVCTAARATIDARNSITATASDGTPTGNCGPLPPRVDCTDALCTRTDSVDIDVLCNDVELVSKTICECTGVAEACPPAGTACPNDLTVASLASPITLQYRWQVRNDGEREVAYVLDDVQFCADLPPEGAGLTFVNCPVCDRTPPLPAGTPAPPAGQLVGRLGTTAPSNTDNLTCTLQFVDFGGMTAEQHLSAFLAKDNGRVATCGLADSCAYKNCTKVTAYPLFITGGANNTANTNRVGDDWQVVNSGGNTAHTDNVIILPSVNGANGDLATQTVAGDDQLVNGDISGFCGAVIMDDAMAFLRISTCDVDVVKQVRCLPDCVAPTNDASIPFLDMLDNVTPDIPTATSDRDCLQYRIRISNGGTGVCPGSPICAFEIKDVMTNDGQFTSTSPFEVTLAGKCCDTLDDSPATLGGFDWNKTIVCQPTSALVTGEFCELRYKARVNPKALVTNFNLDPNNRVDVRAAVTCPATTPPTPVLLDSCAGFADAQVNLKACGVTAKKEVRCNDPAGPYTESCLEVLDNSKVTYKITVCNPGPAGDPNRVNVDSISMLDAGNCGITLTAGTVRTCIGAATCIPTSPAAGDFATFVLGVEKTYDFGHRPAGSQFLAPGECVVLEYDAMITTPPANTTGVCPTGDCSNTVTVKSFSSTACGPCNGAADSVALDIKKPCIECIDKTIDVGDGRGPLESVTLQNPNPSLGSPLVLKYATTVRNCGETTLANVMVCDLALVNHAKAAGATFVGCQLCDDPACTVVGDGCFTAVSLAAGATSPAVMCTIVIDSLAKLEDFTNRDGSDDNCYDNQSGTKADAGLCGNRRVEDNANPNCRARVCYNTTKPPCPPTKAKFDIWNQNELRFSGTERCVVGWDQQLFSIYTNPGVPNNLLRTILQTNKGRARIDGIATTPDICSRCAFRGRECAPLGRECSGVDAQGVPFDNRVRAIPGPLVGVAAKVAVFVDPPRNLELAGTNLYGGDETEIGQLAFGQYGADSQRAAAGPALKSSRRADVSTKGSLVIFPKVEVKFNAADQMIQDTFIDLANHFPADVEVQMYFVNGDQPTAPVVSGNPLTCTERAHSGCNWVDVKIRLTANQPTYWSAFTGLGGVSVTPWPVLDPPVQTFPPCPQRPGRPDTDFWNLGGRTVRGYIVAWAVNTVDTPNGTEVHEIRWNHLSGDAMLINYRDSYAWDYTTWNFAAIAGMVEGDELLAPYGTLDLDGIEYALPPARLLMDFYATGTILTVGGPAQRIRMDTDLTLYLLCQNYIQPPPCR